MRTSALDRSATIDRRGAPKLDPIWTKNYGIGMKQTFKFIFNFESDLQVVNHDKGPKNFAFKSNSN